MPVTSLLSSVQPWGVSHSEKRLASYPYGNMHRLRFEASSVAVKGAAWSKPGLLHQASFKKHRLSASCVHTSRIL